MASPNGASSNPFEATMTYGFAPNVPTTYVTNSAAFSTPAIGSTVVFDTVHQQSDLIPYNSSTGVFSLQIGKLYRMFAGFFCTMGSSSDVVEFQWTNSAGGVLEVHMPTTVITADNSAFSASNLAVIEIMFIPGGVASQSVVVQTVAKIGTSSFGTASPSWMMIQQMSP